MMNLYVKSGLQKVVRKTKILKLISKRFERLEKMTPAVNGKFFRAEGQLYTADVEGTETIQMLSGCVMPLTQGNQMRAAVRTLNKANKDVEVPLNQGCCGAINSHVGDLGKAKELARANIEAFSKGSGTEPIIVNSAGCGARMREYGHLLSDDPDYASKAVDFSKRVVDINEYLDQAKLQPGETSIPKTVTYLSLIHI